MVAPIREAQSSEIRPCAKLLADAFAPRWPFFAALAEVTLVQRMMLGAFQEGRSKLPCYELLLATEQNHSTILLVMSC